MSNIDDDYYVRLTRHLFGKPDTYYPSEDLRTAVKVLVQVRGYGADLNDTLDSAMRFVTKEADKERQRREEPVTRGEFEDIVRPLTEKIDAMMRSLP